jgi:twitching motility protein PilU
MDRQQAANYVQGLLRKAVELDASDLFVTVGAPPSAKINGEITHLAETSLSTSHTQMLVRSIMSDKQVSAFEDSREANFAISLPGVARFRVNAFMQRGSVGMVLRMIRSEIPKFSELMLPPILEEISMTKRGLVIFVGATSSGKSTSLAAMLDYRNENSAGHIVTIEDPIEYVHRHKKSLVTQREVGVDTLHANNTNQALDRIINFFPEERRLQLLMDLSLNLKSVISQRLLRKEEGSGRVPAVEVLINSPLISDLIFKGDVHEIKEVMKRSRELGMQTFDQALLDLYDQGLVSYQEALRNADSQNDLRLNIKLHSNRGLPKGHDVGDEGLSVEKDD